MRQTGLTFFLTALLSTHVSLVHAGEPEATKPLVFKGQALPAAKALTAAGVKADTDTAGILFVADDKSIYSLVKDQQTRMLFLDTRLQGRPIQLEARIVPGSHHLQVSTVRTIKDGKLHEVVYWCDNCQLAWTEPGACKCCGGETELIEAPVEDP